MRKLTDRNSTLPAFSRNESGGAGGKTLVWLAFLAILGGGGYWAWKNPDEANRLIGEGKRLVGMSAESSPTPSEQATATTPNSNLATPGMPNPTASTAQGQTLPPPLEATVDMAALASTPARWPKTVTLKKGVKFPIVLDGRIAGSIALSAGTVLTLKAVKDGKLTVMHQNTLATIAPQDTDLAEKVARDGAAAVGQ